VERDLLRAVAAGCPLLKSIDAAISYRRCARADVRALLRGCSRLRTALRCDDDDEHRT
jgi:hypothetical protein